MSEPIADDARWKRLLDSIEQELREVTLVNDRYDQGYRDALHWVMGQMPKEEAFGLQCECCHLQRPTTKKYPGIGYYCDACMNDGCFEDECQAQSPTGPWPEFKRQPDGRYTTDRQFAIHQRLHHDG